MRIPTNRTKIIKALASKIAKIAKIQDCKLPNTDFVVSYVEGVFFLMSDSDIYEAHSITELEIQIDVLF